MDHLTIRSLRKILETIEETGSEPEGGLSRLSAIALGDFPRALYKLQTLGADGSIRVVPSFVTPLLPVIIDRYREVLGNLDVRDAALPVTDDSPIVRSLVSIHETSFRSREEIEGYFSAHFARTDNRELGRVFSEDLSIKEVFLIPVRPATEPFGVISVSSPRVLAEWEREYWRLMAASVAALYRRERQQRRGRLHALAFDSEEVPAVLLDSEGGVAEVNDAALTLLGWGDRDATIRHLGDLRPCLPRREALESPVDDAAAPPGGSFYLPTKNGGDREFSVEVQALHGASGSVAGAVVRFRPSDARVSSPRLSRRQREVARLLSEGLRPKEIAAQIGLSIHTVNYHRNQLAKKLASPGRGTDLSELVGQLFLGRR